MPGGKQLWALAFCFCLLVFLMVSAWAAEPEITNDLKEISPQHHEYLFSVIGGTAVGIGVGVLLGGGNDITKGLLVGGGMSALSLHSHRHDSLNGWRNWANVASYSSLGGGLAGRYAVATTAW